MTGRRWTTVLEDVSSPLSRSPFLSRRLTFDPALLQPSEMPTSAPVSVTFDLTIYEAPFLTDIESCFLPADEVLVRSPSQPLLLNERICRARLAQIRLLALYPHSSPLLIHPTTAASAALTSSTCVAHFCRPFTTPPSPDGPNTEIGLMPATPRPASRKRSRPRLRSETR